MKLFIKIIILSCFFIFSTGCVTGIAFRNVIEPLSTDFKNTPVATKKVVIKGSDFVKLYNISIEWNNQDLINKIGKRYGFKKIYYIDVENFSIFGYFGSSIYYVYGE